MFDTKKKNNLQGRLPLFMLPKFRWNLCENCICNL